MCVISLYLDNIKVINTFQINYYNFKNITQKSSVKLKKVNLFNYIGLLSPKCNALILLYIELIDIYLYFIVCF